MSLPFALSTLARGMRPSPIRELFPLIRRPGMISFAGGLPAPDAFPVEAFAACADVLAARGREVLQYGASEGWPELREVLLERMTAHLGRPVAGDELLVTTGSQQALDLLARGILDPGDTVVVEGPTYPGALHSLRNVGARFAAVPSDGDGMLVDALPEVVAAVERETGKRPRLVYVVPDFANPTGACLTLARRRRLVELAAALGIPVLEDDPYGRVRFRGEALPAVTALAAGSPWVLYAGSFSKVLAPGVRLGWLVGPPELVRAMVMLRQGSDLCPPTVTQALVAEYCRRGHLEGHLERVIATYRVRAEAMQRALRAELPEGAASWREPDGGFFHWLRFPGRDATALFRSAVAQGVAFVPGVAFYPELDEQVGGRVVDAEHARLAFTFADEAGIVEGCRRLARALAE